MFETDENPKLQKALWIVYKVVLITLMWGLFLLCGIFIPKFLSETIHYVVFFTGITFVAVLMSYLTVTLIRYNFFNNGFKKSKEWSYVRKKKVKIKGKKPLSYLYRARQAFSVTSITLMSLAGVWVVFVFLDTLVFHLFPQGMFNSNMLISLALLFLSGIVYFLLNFIVDLVIYEKVKKVVLADYAYAEREEAYRLPNANLETLGEAKIYVPFEGKWGLLKKMQNNRVLISSKKLVIEVCNQEGLLGEFDETERYEYALDNLEIHFNQGILHNKPFISLDFIVKDETHGKLLCVCPMTEELCKTIKQRELFKRFKEKEKINWDYFCASVHGFIAELLVLGVITVDWGARSLIYRK